MIHNMHQLLFPPSLKDRPLNGTVSCSMHVVDCICTGVAIAPCPKQCGKNLTLRTLKEVSYTAEQNDIPFTNKHCERYKYLLVDMQVPSCGWNLHGHQQLD